MIKKDFVGRFSEITGENKKNSKDLVEAFLDLSADILAEDDNLQFVGWGGFVVKETPARRVTSKNIWGHNYTCKKSCKVQARQKYGKSFGWISSRGKRFRDRGDKIFN